ncbi:collectin-11 [Plakobranchus ocellatus]|uniref:Collectin-11 n=1 Tax=Plakobranchus ocellatus TaxID=259542 RepID=A0AAV4D4R4_9GAST|nr:collectin-11 [Plakobranchus ocellatus]
MIADSGRGADDVDLGVDRGKRADGVNLGADRDRRADGVFLGADRGRRADGIFLGADRGRRADGTIADGVDAGAGSGTIADGVDTGAGSGRISDGVDTGAGSGTIADGVDAGASSGRTSDGVDTGTGQVSKLAIRMSPLPILLLFGVLMIGPVHGYVSYDVSAVFRGRRYKISREYEPFNLATMNDRCKQIGGYLVHFDDGVEQDKVAAFTSGVPGEGPYFTGITDNEREGWFYTYNDKKWANYHRFRWFQPDNWHNEDCVEITGSGLNDIACGTNGKYVCEVPV